jgi:hypothetical protein
MSVEPHPHRPTRYRAVNRAAVLSVAAGALSFLTFLHWAFALLPVAGILLGWLGLRQIGRMREEATGERLAWSGICLSAAFFLVGAAWLIFQGVHEVPFGYQRVEYAELQPDPTIPKEIVPPKAMELDDKKIFIKGYMMPAHQHVRLKRFRVCPSNGQCAYCTPNPKRTEIIQVQLTGDLVTDYTTLLVRIGGRLHVDPEDPHGLPYTMEADYIR